MKRSLKWAVPTGWTWRLLLGWEGPVVNSGGVQETVDRKSRRNRGVRLGFMGNGIRQKSGSGPVQRAIRSEVTSDSLALFCYI